MTSQGVQRCMCNGAGASRVHRECIAGASRVQRGTGNGERGNATGNGEIQRRTGNVEKCNGEVHWRNAAEEGDVGSNRWGPW